MPLVTLVVGVAATTTAATPAFFNEGGDHYVEPEVLEVLEPLILLALFLSDSEGTMVNVRIFCLIYHR